MVSAMNELRFRCKEPRCERVFETSRANRAHFIESMRALALHLDEEHGIVAGALGRRGLDAALSATAAEARDE